MKTDQLDIIVTLQAHRQAGATENNTHTYKVFIDDKEYASNTVTETKFVDSFIVNLSVELEPGTHTLKVQYCNPEQKGVLQIQNIYVGGEYGGVNADSLIRREGKVVYTSERTEIGKVGIWWNGTYHFNFESPFFYWALSKFPI